MNGVHLKHAKQRAVKGHERLFAQLQHLQSVDLKADEYGKVHKDAFCEHLETKLSVDKNVALSIFEAIDVNNDGVLSVMEVSKWKSKHLRKAETLLRFFDTDAPQNEDEDDNKCPQCKIYRREIKVCGCVPLLSALTL